MKAKTKAAAMDPRQEQVKARLQAIYADAKLVSQADAEGKTTYTRPIPSKEGTLETHVVTAGEGTAVRPGVRVLYRLTECGMKTLDSNRVSSPPEGVKVCEDCTNPQKLAAKRAAKKAEATKKAATKNTK